MPLEPPTCLDPAHYFEMFPINLHQAAGTKAAAKLKEFSFPDSSEKKLKNGTGKK